MSEATIRRTRTERVTLDGFTEQAKCSPTFTEEIAVTSAGLKAIDVRVFAEALAIAGAPDAARVLVDPPNVDAPRLTCSWSQLLPGDGSE